MGISVNGNGIQLPDIITGDVYTVIIRFKPDEHHPWTTSYNNFLNLGYSMVNKRGFMLGVYDNPADNCPRISIGPKAYLQPFPATFCMTNSVFTKRSSIWHEMAFIVSKPSENQCKIRAALFRPGWAGVENNGKTGQDLWAEKLLTISDEDKAYAIKTPIPNPGALRLGCEGDADKTQFRGKIHMVAFWNRALSDDEVRTAFGAPNPGVFRVGFPGQDGTKFFASTVGEETTITPEPENWHKAPATLERGKAFTINFTLRECQDGLNQILRLTPYEGTGTVAIELDGEPVSTATPVTAGSTARVNIRGKRLLTAGDHSLTICRTDAGANDLVLSCVELSGSWQFGLDDRSWNDMNTAGATTGEFYDVEGNLRHFRRVILGTYQQNIHFTVPADVVNYPSRFVWKTTASYKNKKMRLLLNGTEVYNENVVDNVEHTLKIPSGTLRAGENILRMEDSSGTDGYYGFDFLRYEVVLYSGFIILVK